ncbi:MAG: PAS domain S-box protein [Spirochaetaceae bacterium]
MSTNNHKILLVEDEAIIAMSEKRALEEYGYTVVLAHSGLGAIKAVEQDSEVELILMDIDLGSGMDGTEAAEAILSLRDLPIIFLSSHTERAVVERTEGITSYGYVVKNSGITVLDAAIKMAFRLYEAHRSIKTNNMQLAASNEQLRETNEEVTRWQTLLEYIVYHDRSAIAVLDKDLIFRYVSRRFLEDYGIEEGLVGSHHYDAVPEIPEKWRTVHQRALQGEVLRSDFDTFEREDGRVDFVTWECRPWYDVNGSVGGIVLYTEVITERVTNERQYRLLADNATDLVYRYQLVPEPAFTYVSPSATAVTGYTPEEHYADPELGSRLIHPEDRQVLSALATDPESVENPVILRWITKDGSVISAEQTYTPIYDDNGTLIALEVIARNVTPRQLAKEELQRSERRYKTLVDNSPDIIYLFGTKSGGIFWSKATRRILGFDPEDVLRDPFLWNRSVHPEDRSKVEDAIARATAGESFNIEYRIRSADGEWIWLRDRLIDRWDTDEEFVIQGHAEDITQQKVAEEQVLEYQWRLESILEGAQVGTWEWNVQTGEVVLNEKWAEIVGYTLEELEPVSIETWERLAVDEDLAEANAMLQQHFAGEIPYYDVEVRMTHRSGEVVWVRDRGKVVSWTEDGRPLRMFGTHTDVTDRKAAEERSERLLEEKEQLLKEVHHRIKNNMNTVRSLLSLQANDTEDPTVQEALQDAVARLHSMQLLYDQLYRSSDYRVISAEEYMRNLVPRVAELFPYFDTVRLEISVEPVMLNNRSLSSLGMIVTEWITNAFKHSFVPHASRETEKGIRLVGRKSGREMEFIFASYGGEKPDEETLRNSDGFGLRMVDALVEQLHGELRTTVDNETRFELRFPLL